MSSFDVVLYHFQPVKVESQEDKRQATSRDEILEQVIDKLLKEKTNGEKPLVIYATRGTRIEGETQEKLNEYPLHHIANNTISLIDNTASAFRVAKLMQGS